MVAWWGAVLGQLHATFVDSSPGGGRALSLVALLVAQPLAQAVAQPLAQAVALPVACGVGVNGEGRHAVWRWRACGVGC